MIHPAPDVTRFRVLLLLLIIACSCATRTAISTPNPFGDEFWLQWGDGKAELAAYDLVMPRYEELRRGTAVTIFVTEPFSDSLRVKADPGRHPDSDVFQVMKLNLVRDFPTGIYDYNLMTSVFIALQPTRQLAPGGAAKVSFSSQEWCGNVYQQLVIRPPRAEYDVHSYFDGEADQRRQQAWRSDALAEDAVLLWARGLAAPFMNAGETREVSLLPSLMAARLEHAAPSWKSATLSVAAVPQSVTVPAGTFDTEVRSVEIRDGRTWTIFVERAAPHRIIRWSVIDGEEGQLVGSDRLAYWKMNGSEFTSAVERLGLKPRPPRTP
jgi:hypothetical protein